MNFFEKLRKWIVKNSQRLFWARHNVKFNIVHWNQLPNVACKLPYMEVHGHLEIGHCFRIRGVNKPPQIMVGRNGVMKIGNHCGINEGAEICAHHNVTLGDFCRIGFGAKLYDDAFHDVDPHTPIRRGPITLGKNVWIAQGAIVLSNVSIGDHSVVAAGAVVTKDVPPRCMVAGAPAVIVKRFECDDGWVRS